MMISTKGRYALRAMVDLAANSDADTFATLAGVAERQQISEKYLESIVSLLVKAGLVVGQRGKGGGYKLTRPAEDYTVTDVLHVTEGTLAPVACLGCEVNNCERADKCPTLPMWEGLDAAVNNYLGSITIADLVKNGIERGGIILTPRPGDEAEEAEAHEGVPARPKKPKIIDPTPR